MPSVPSLVPANDATAHPVLDNLVAFLIQMQSNPAVHQLEQAALAALLAYITRALPQPPTN